MTNVGLQKICLKNFCLIKSSSRVFAKEYVEKGIPFFRSKDVIDKSLGIFKKYDLYISESRFKELRAISGSPSDGDLLISSVGNRSGQAYVVDGDGDFYFKDGNIIWISQFDGLDSHFLCYFFNSTYGQKMLKSIMIGSAQKAITIDSLRNLEISIPSLSYQKSSIRILKTLDKKIELNLKMNKTLEEIAKTLFKSWFIDFDPVRAKAEGRPTGLSKEISDLFPDSFENSELGEMPSGWKVGNLGNLCVPKRGKVITKAKVEPGNFPVVAGGIKPPYYHSESNAESPIVTISASGTAGFVNLYYEDIWASDCSYINKEITDNVFFIYSFLKINQQRIYDLRHGAVQQHVYPKDLIELPIFLSSNSLIEEYEKIATSFHEKISLNIQESKHLEAIRDTLLPRLISGELQIPDAENVVKEADI